MKILFAVFISASFIGCNNLDRILNGRDDKPEVVYCEPDCIFQALEEK